VQGAPYGLDCNNCPRTIDRVPQCDSWGNVKSYPFEGDRVLNRDWDSCPARPLKDPRLVLAATYYRASQISPLDGWPDSYAAWLHRMIVEIDTGVQSRGGHD